MFRADVPRALPAGGCATTLWSGKEACAQDAQRCPAPRYPNEQYQDADEHHMAEEQVMTRDQYVAHLGRIVAE
jgi:hypothetical protein